MKNLILSLFALLAFVVTSNAQTIKINAPIIVGMPNIGTEISLGSKFSLNADVLYSPYTFQNTGKVFKFLTTSLEMRYYMRPNPYNYYKMFEGFYMGPYAQYARYNVGLKDKRYNGWGIASGVSLGYQLYLSEHFRMDFNIGIGYAQMEYDVYRLGVCNTAPESCQQFSWWIGPTKAGISLAYYIF